MTTRDPAHLEARLRALVDTVDGGEAPRFESWGDLLAFAAKAAQIGAGADPAEDQEHDVCTACGVIGTIDQPCGECGSLVGPG